MLNTDMKKFLITFLTLLFAQITGLSEELHFDNEMYKLKFSALAQKTGGYGNEYFRNTETVSNWTKMLGIYSYPKVDNPIQFAKDFDKTIEKTENCVFLKLVENKKENKAVLSFITNGTQNSKNYFEYDVYKFEKLKSGGMIVIKYAAKHFFTSNKEIDKIAKNIKQNNDKYLGMLIVSATPTVIEKDIFPTDN